MNIYEYGKDNLSVFFARLKERTLEFRVDIEETVRGILHSVKQRGDKALLEYTQKFDGVDLPPGNIEVSKEEIEAAFLSVDRSILKIIEKAAENIRRFHEKQKENSWFTTGSDGVLLGQKVTPLERVGVYVPAGSAPLPSSVLMNVIPAKVARVSEVILCSPPGKNGKIDPLILACCKLTGVDRVYRVGGAQAVGGMAYGTESIPKTDKIVGPGNIYVATAKKLVFGQCDIDMVAGPSEILVIADDTAKPEFVAADLLSQAEHDTLSSCVLVTTSKILAEKVTEQIQIQLSQLSRKEIASESIKNFGAIIITQTIEQAVDIANIIAPEHLEVCVNEPFAFLNSIKNAGAIFLGNYSPEPLGDYFAGPNHTLPTTGSARFFSPLGVYDFVKYQSVIYYNKEAFNNISEDVAAFADAEGLFAHANAIRIRGRRTEDE